ncbi:MAG: dicarboxylate/amino acid:cation symporter [Sutterella sp.]|nr:dicarboxylate/amino acid:cation symporter [Sutterella sp.]
MSSKMKISLAWQMMIGLALGVIVGAIVDSSFAQTWLQPLGTLFIRLIRMVVVPLVLATIIAGAAGISDTSKLGRVAGKVLLIYAITTAIAVASGLFFAGVIHPGLGLDLSTEGLKAKEVVAPPLVQTLLNIVPINPMEAMSKGAMLQIIFFAVIFGFALSGLGERGKPVLHFFEIVGDVMIRVTHMVMLYAPIGVFGLMSYTVSRHGLSVLLPLGALILTAFIATLVFVVVILIPMVRFITGIPVMTFLKGIAEPWLVAFTTCSSAAALPANLNAARRLGSTKAIASFSIPLGNTINMNGTAIYMGVCAIFAAEVYGLPLSMADQLTIVLMGVLAAIGTAGVPGAGLIMTTIIFTQVGIPLEAVALIAGVDRILDMIRTSVNVVGDVASAITVTKLEGDMNSEPFVEGQD